MSKFKIAIIGAGPAGCTLAKLLTQANVDVTVFERETSADARSQGGSLDLHTKTGLAALREAGLYEEFLKYARFDGEALKVTDKKLKAYLSLPGTTEGQARGRPEIDRESLRKILNESLPAGTIQWGHRLMSVSDDLTLHFEQGEKRGFDLIVGADGAWSKVRPLLTDVKPQHAQIGGFHFSLSDPENRHPDLYKLVNRGSIFSYSDGHGLTLQQLGDGSLYCGEWGIRDENWEKVQDLHDGKAIKSFLLGVYSDWAPELRKFIEVADDSGFYYRSIYLLPTGSRWENRPGVTLVGDAAHLTVPFAGEGVNIAMTDSMLLAKVIIEAETQQSEAVLAKGVKAFEEDMFKRAKQVADRACGNMNDMFSKGAPRTVIERFVSRGLQSQMGPILGSVATIVVYIFYWFFKFLY